MGNEINELDDFIRQQMDGYKATPPQGVFEGIDQAINSGAGSTATGSLLSKGIGKIILGIASVGVIGSGVYLYQSGVLEVVGSGKREAGRAKLEVGSRKMGEKVGVDQIANLQAKNGNNFDAISNGNKPQQTVICQGSTDSIIEDDFGPQGPWEFDDESPSSKLSNPNSILANGNKGDGGKTTAPTNNSFTKLELSIEGPSELCPGQEAIFRVSCNKKADAIVASFANEDVQVPVKDLRFNHKFTKVGKTFVFVEAFVDGGMHQVSREVNIQPLQTSFEVDYRNYPELRFVAKDNAEQYRWSFGENDKVATQNEIRHRFDLPTEGDSQVLEVRLDAKNNVGCQATFVQPLTLYRLNEPIVPNVFTPNGDGLNDRFEIYTKNLETYHLTIFNRMGIKVFESNSAENTWDGSVEGRTNSGSYYYQFEYRHKGMAMPKTITGNLTVLKQN